MEIVTRTCSSDHFTRKYLYLNGIANVVRILQFDWVDYLKRVILMVMTENNLEVFL